MHSEGNSSVSDMVSRQDTTERSAPRALRPGHVFMGVIWELGRTKGSPCERESWGNWPIGELLALRWNLSPLNEPHADYEKEEVTRYQVRIAKSEQT